MAHVAVPGTAVEGLLDSALAFLKRHAPFDRMEPPALRALIGGVSLGYYPKGTVILQAHSAEPEYLYIVQRGLIHYVEAADGSRVPLAPGEMFPVAALLDRRPTVWDYVAAADTFCYQVPAETFRATLESSPRLQAFATDYLSSLLKDSRRRLALEHSAFTVEQQAMGRTLRSLIKRPPLSCRPTAPISEVLRSMQDGKVGSVLVEESDGKLVGIFTRRDVLERVALAQYDLNAPISSVMTMNPRTLPADASAYEAAVEIAHHGIRHVPVMDGGRAIGVVTERDLFALQRMSLRAINRTISHAMDLEDLQAAASDIRRAARTMLGQGLAAEQLTHLVSTLNDALTARLLEIEQARHDLAGIKWSWLAFGSEGRYEQTISTDQDNGIIFAATADASPEQARARLLPFAITINNALDACGFPLCKGGIMAGNPRWCLSSDEWIERYGGWIENTSPEALLDAVIMFDFRAVHGETALAESLRTQLLAMTTRNQRFQKQLAQYALETAPPLGMLGDFVTERRDNAPHTINLKSSGARLFVDAARVLSLAAGTRHTNTAQRLREAGTRLNMAPEEIAAAVEAFFVVQGLRLRTQLGHGAGSIGEGSNRLDLDQLNDIDRRVLKESLRQARKLQTRLKLDYDL